MDKQPRTEYPRPQMVREGYVNLNGQWDFAFDFGKSGRERKMYEKDAAYPEKILVPFCPESKLSGIEYKDFMNAVWYRRGFTVPAEWKDARTVLHFGAVDYYCEVYVNEKKVGSHAGGYTSFCFDITDYLAEGENTLAVYAEDEGRSGRQPRGKQCGNYYSGGCDYTRTTGIWQTVWLERLPESHIKNFKVYPNPDDCSVTLEVDVTYPTGAAALTVKAAYEGREMGTVTLPVTGHTLMVYLKLAERQLWEAGKGRLYDLTLTYADGACQDRVESYFGLRSVSWDNKAMYLNGKKVFQRLVLDQGFYPDGVYTAPTDEDLKKDIELSLAVGFNGARLHEKIFDPRFLYWADKLGYLVWGEHANWGLEIWNGEGLRNFLPEWLEALERDFNHPAIVGWCPFNETWDGRQRQDDGVLSTVYHATKAIDHTRPVIDTSGNFHVITDIFDVHDYEQDTAKFAEHYAAMKAGGEAYVTFADRQKYEGQPYFVSEYGGTWWIGDERREGWGYGTQPKDVEELAERYVGLTSALLDNPQICAFCYTQLYDVEQEQNGMYTYSRKKKFPEAIYEKIRAVNTKKAAIED